MTHERRRRLAKQYLMRLRLAPNEAIRWIAKEVPDVNDRIEVYAERDRIMRKAEGEDNE